jgi:molybdopterin/thiamine biosynthesis adenylyltransferase/rhodanese-related sulfurtransferase
MALFQNNERYSRHLSLQGFGASGQQKLSEAKVLVIGAGGLGCPVLQYLAAAGVGTIGIADDDVVSLSNLQRQILYQTNDVGQKKALVAAARLSALNPEISIITYLVRVNNTIALDLFADYDIIVDGSDNFVARYLINDACVILNKPLVFAAVYQYEGQLAVFNVEDEHGFKANYRDLFEHPPAAEDAPDCNEAGVLGVLPGTMGIMQANEVIKLITGIGKPLVNKLLIYQSLDAETYTVTISPGGNNTVIYPNTREAFLNTDYAWFCNAGSADIEEVDAEKFYELLTNSEVAVIDVRERGEMPDAEFDHRNIPLSRLSRSVPDILEPKILLFCQSGKRSMQAATVIKKRYNNQKQIYSLKGGIFNLLD